MIALWMLYAILSSVCILAACHLLERFAIDARLATRGVWIGALTLMIIVPLWGLIPRSSEAPAVPAHGQVLAPARPDAATGSGSATSEYPAASDSRIKRAMRKFQASVAAAGQLLDPLNRPLLLVWALMSAFLAGVMGHAAIEGQRLRHAAEVISRDGDTLLLTQNLGPSAVGIGDAAIVLPRWALDLEEEQLALILRHEREHLQARDPLLLLVALLAVVLAPWHLPLWYARRRLRLAIELDCDARVLRAQPDVRQYAQLLLTTVRQSYRPAWADSAVAAVVAPLRPQTSHLARRLSTMTNPHSRQPLRRAAALAVGVAVIGAVLFTIPSPRSTQAMAQTQAQVPADQERAIVHLTRVGTTDAALPMDIVIYTTGAAQVGIRGEAAALLADTLRLTGLPAITADVTEGEVHIELRSPGTISVGGTVTGGPAREVSASGRHIILFEGGRGISGMGLPLR